MNSPVVPLAWSTIRPWASMPLAFSSAARTAAMSFASWNFVNRIRLLLFLPCGSAGRFMGAKVCSLSRNVDWGKDDLLIGSDAHRNLPPQKARPRPMHHKHLYGAIVDGLGHHQHVSHKRAEIALR